MKIWIGCKRTRSNQHDSIELASNKVKKQSAKALGLLRSRRSMLRFHLLGTTSEIGMCKIRGKAWRACKKKSTPPDISSFLNFNQVYASCDIVIVGLIEF